jgi:nucleotide-binding universal stress UspA family protein
MSRRILVAVDDSPQAWDALEYALDRFQDADVTILSVLDPVETVLGREDPSAPGPEDAEAEVDAVLEEATEIASEFDAEVTTDHVSGDPANEIVAYAEETDVDHIVVGSHGRSGLSRVLLGSTAETIVRRSPVPVTVVKGDS